jgi:hypothetical protein
LPVFCQNCNPKTWKKKLPIREIFVFFFHNRFNTLNDDEEIGLVKNECLKKSTRSSVARLSFVGILISKLEEESAKTRLSFVRILFSKLLRRNYKHADFLFTISLTQ